MALDKFRLVLQSSLVKNFEQTLTNPTAKLNLYFIRLMLKRLANDIEPKWVLSESQRE